MSNIYKTVLLVTPNLMPVSYPHLGILAMSPSSLIAIRPTEGKDKRATWERKVHGKSGVEVCSAEEEEKETKVVLW